MQGTLPGPQVYIGMLMALSSLALKPENHCTAGWAGWQAGRGTHTHTHTHTEFYATVSSSPAVGPAAGASLPISAECRACSSTRLGVTQVRLSSLPASTGFTAFFTHVGSNHTARHVTVVVVVGWSHDRHVTLT